MGESWKEISAREKMHFRYTTSLLTEEHLKACETTDPDSRLERNLHFSHIKFCIYK